MCQSEGRSDFVYSVVKKTLNMENNTQIHTCSFQLTWYLTGKIKVLDQSNRISFLRERFSFSFLFWGAGGWNASLARTLNSHILTAELPSKRVSDIQVLLDSHWFPVVSAH